MRSVSKIKKIYHFLLAYAAYWFYGRPARKLIVIGVTGTKGKSTTCRFIASTLQAAGHKVGMLSTVEFQIGEKMWRNEKKMTMLGRGQIHKMLGKMVKAGCKYAVVETSSEGVMQYRHAGLLYDIAVFTNLGTEHQERHGGFENLKMAKGELFAALSKHPKKKIGGKEISTVSVVNAGDPHAQYFSSFSADQKFLYVLKSNEIKKSEILGRIISSDERGTIFTVESQEFKLNIVGEFNVPNALAAIAVGRSQGINDEQIAEGLASVTSIPGRMEFINGGQPFKVVVDFAHEPLSFAALFGALRQIIGQDKKIISVIGSDGGGRDIGKRGRMGQVAGELTDIVLVTDVNCYDEDPRAIAEMLAKGAREAGKKDGENLFVEVDRKLAIARAFDLAKPGDAVAIVAKGTEPAIIVGGGRRISWDDRTVARELLVNKFSKSVV